MPVPTTVETIASCEDVDLLWQALVAAKQEGASRQVRAAENRMRELQGQRRYAHLTDEELSSRVRGAQRNREPKDMLGYSPGGGPGGDSGGGEDLMRFNRAIRGNQADGVETTLAALLAEQERRAAS